MAWEEIEDECRYCGDKDKDAGLVLRQCGCCADDFHVCRACIEGAGSTCAACEHGLSKDD
jgi:hypothetical protein